MDRDLLPWAQIGWQGVRMSDGEASGVEARVTERELEFERVQKIGQIGGLTMDLRGGQFRNTRSPEYLAVHGLPPQAAHKAHEDGFV